MGQSRPLFIGVEGEHAEHLTTTTTAQAKLLFVLETDLKFGRNVRVGSPMSKVVETLFGAAENSGLDEPDADHCSSSSFST